MSKSSINFARVAYYSWSDLFMIDFEIMNSLDAFAKYISGNEELIARINREWLEEIKKDDILNSELHDALFKAQWYSHRFENEELVNKEVTGRHRLWAFVSIYSFFEGKLKELCIKVELKMGAKVKLEDISDARGYVNQYWEYLTVGLKIDDTRAKEYFEKLKSLKTYRNKIVHENGFIEDLKIRESIRKSEGLEVDAGGHLKIVNVIFLNEVLNNVRLFFQETLKSIDVKCE